MLIDLREAFGFHAEMRSLLLLWFAATVARCATPAPLAAALANFRTDGAPGWSYVQTSVAGTESLVERYDAEQMEFTRWSLIAKNGRPATESEQREYREKQTRRSSGGTAPKITESLDLTRVEVVSEDSRQTVYSCCLKPGEQGDKTAKHLRAILVLNKVAGTIERLEIFSTSAFAPTLGIKIAEMKTVMHFSVPAAEMPSVLLKVTTQLRGRAFFFRSLDQDLTATYSEHVKAFRK